MQADIENEHRLNSIIIQAIDALDWSKINDAMHQQGYAIIPKFLAHSECTKLIQQYASAENFRKTVVMERHRFGYGEYRYFDYPLPPIVELLRQSLYGNLVNLANLWMQRLGDERRFPATLALLLAACKQHQQCKATPLILKYRQGGFNTLHQDLYGEVYFPLQAMILLNQPQTDFTGGEFVLTQQVPRAQSSAIVLNPQLGDLLIFATRFFPINGKKGYYRANMKHGISKIHEGQRHALGISFHDAQS